MGLTTLIHDRLTREFGRNIFFNDLVVVVVKVFPLTTEHFGNQESQDLLMIRLYKNNIGHN